jgi:GAF domain-containing protein
MRRGAKPSKARVESKIPVAPKSRKNEGSRVRDLEKRLAEALEQQTATSEILSVISSSPTDLRPVFNTIVQSGLQLLGGYSAVMLLVQDDQFHLAAYTSTGTQGDDSVTRLFPVPMQEQPQLRRAVLEKRPVVVEDAETEPGFTEAMREMIRARGWRSSLQMPMMRDNNVIGLLNITRQDPGSFASDEIALLGTFGAQAVIAIENARLFNETKEALERQTATSEILRVINSSPGDIQPVFDAIAANAARLCDAVNGLVIRFDGQLLHLAAHHNVDPERLAAVRQAYPRPPSRGALSGRAILTRAVVHVPDVSKDREYTLPAATTIGYRSVLAVPMIHEGVARGTILVARDVVAPFSDTHIALIQTFADQAVIAIENVRLFTELQEKNSALTQAHAQVTEALGQQTATAEILRVISSSPTDLQPVFDAILRSAQRLLGARTTSVFRRLTDEIHLAAFTSAGEVGDAAYAALFPMSLDDYRERFPFAMLDWVTGSVTHVPDVELDMRSPEIARRLARARGFRSVLQVPMRREGQVIGVLGITRSEAGVFAEDEIALAQTFADQAVIAIENVRLFTELQEKNQALTTAHAQVTEALEQQTATAEILRVISGSPTDAQPVFDAIARSATSLCDAYDAWVGQLNGDLLRVAAHHGSIPAPVGAVVPAIRGIVTGRSVIDRRTVHVADLQAEADEFPGGSAAARSLGHRTILSVPLLREGVAIGAIALRRTEVQPFTDRQIALVTTFADQAVIAIENVRLFKELEERNRDLTTALDTQTATSDILRAISRSQTDTQPVFDAILGSAVRLLGAYSGGLTRIAGDQITLAALTSTDPAGDAVQRATYPQPLDSEHSHAQAIRSCAPLNVADAQEDPRFPETVRVAARARGFRSLVTVPLLRHDEPLGAITVTRREAGGFTDDEIALLKTFADQAVIAIENARLLTELQARTSELTRSVGELRALGEVGQAISSTLDLQTVLSTIVARATELAGVDAGVIYEYDEQREVFVPRATAHLEAQIVETMLSSPVRKGEGVTGRLAEVPEPIQVPDILEAPAESRVRGTLVRAGYRALLAVPLVREDHLLGGLTVLRKATGAFTPEVVELLQTFATQSALAIQNARLFLEIEDKSRQLEAASRHKSEFLANMSHELRTPLNAIIGFSEVLTERMFGDLNEKQEEYLKDIYASGTHLLSLINDILDLSKIEAGRMELELTEFHLPTALDNALTLVRERAGRRSITLQMNVDGRLGEVRADERKIRQVVLNLLSNAIKFTPEGGRIEVRAVPEDGFVEVSVRDTGVGIAPEDQEAVFEEFRQVGTSAAKQEGTGLGLTLCRKFVELHGGRIWVTSQVGVGSTFTFTIPVRGDE